MYDITIRNQAIADYQSGKSIKSISQALKVSKSCINKWVSLYIPHQCKTKNIEYTDAQFLALKRKLERTEREKSILLEAYASLNLSLTQKLAIADTLNGKFMTKEMCRMLDVNFSTFYNHDRRRVKETVYVKKDAYYKEIILDIYNKSEGRFGSNKIYQKMRSLGITVSARKVSKLVKELKIKSKRRNLPIKNKVTITNFYYKNKLMQQFNQATPNCFWVGDTTCLIINRNRFYVCVVMDLFSRKIIAHNVSCTNDVSLTVNTFKAAFEIRNHPNNLTFHSDQGSNYTANKYVQLLRTLKVEQSFSKRGTPYDNAAIESFFSNMKRDDLHSRQFQYFDEIVSTVNNYIYHYNEYRPHESLSFKTPNQVENEYFNANLSDPF